jgi:predicted acetyltransferase
MHLEIIEASHDLHDRLVRNLYQYYLYDFSEMLDLPFGADGLFVDDDIDFMWRAPYSRGYLLRTGSEWGGLAIIEDRRQKPEADEAVINMEEFFVMRKHRRRGVGELFARALFDRYPGPWRVSEVPENVAAQRFWRRVIGAYTGGQFTEAVWTRGARSGPVQYFTAPGPR